MRKTTVTQNRLMRLDMKGILIMCFIIAMSTDIMADIQVPKIFGDHMVLQRGKSIVIWGWADKGEKIKIRLNKQFTTTVTDKHGEWKVRLDPEEAGGPYQLILEGKNKVVISDILIGDVWVCSGQSNMEWPVSKSKDAGIEIQRANSPTIRHIEVAKAIATSPASDIRSGKWEVCTPETVGKFTAVGYYFARELTTDLKVPIGLIHTSWGGTQVESWTSAKAFQESDEFKDMIAKMPRLDLDSLAKKNSKELLLRLERLQGKLPANMAETDAWKNIDYDDSNWGKMEVPLLWEQQALGNFDGIVWLRKTIQVNGQDQKTPARINVGMIDDTDETFINGIKVGSTIQQWNEKRSYFIPPGILKEGENVIAIRIEDTGGGGGIHGIAEDVNFIIGNSVQSLAGPWSYKVESLLENSTGISPNTYPTILYNAMIHPITPMAVKGILWYQGEANVKRASQYKKAFPLMINDWRKRWGQSDLHFYFVQLASFNEANGNSNNGSTWAELREAQAFALSLPNTGMAVTTDIGDPKDIHPLNKQDVGKRLAAIALHKAYRKNIVDSGPVFKSMEVKGGKIILKFDDAENGFVVNDRYGYIKGFEIAGTDKRFHYAKASVDGNTIVVSHENIPEPQAVRFGWADDASDCNVFNAAGFPLAPFRTDDWKGITADAKFDF
jgi:sialate O-acetylesterase